MTPFRMRLRSAALVLCAAAFAGGCSRPVPSLTPLPPSAAVPPPAETLITYEHYLQIDAGMSEEQVRALLGKPAAIEAEELRKDSRVFYTYDNGRGSTLRIGFQNGKVASKSCNLNERKPSPKP